MSSDALPDGSARGPTASQAERADRHELYERAVQAPERAAVFLARVFGELRGRTARVLREDFCGTARLCRTWCQGAPDRRAIGVELDGQMLAQARRRNLEPFGPELAARIELVEADVLDVGPGRVAPADVIAALNFSFCVFTRREVLRRYLAGARAGLAPDGALVLEMFGGPAAMDRGEETTDLGDFTYRWEQESFNPLTDEIVCHIHFDFPDGSSLPRAFSYHWRLWSVPELRDLLSEVGFSDVKIYWEVTDGGGETPEGAPDDLLRGTGEYEPREVAEQQESWLVYVVALR